MNYERAMISFRYLDRFGFSLLSLTDDFNKYWKNVYEAEAYATYLAAAE